MFFFNESEIDQDNNMADDGSPVQASAVGNRLVSTDAKLNLYLFLGKLSIGTACSGRGARKYKNNCAQALTGESTGWSGGFGR